MTHRSHNRSANFAVYGSLWMFAAACALLPVYVHLHPKQFGPPLMTFYGATDSRSKSEQVEQTRTAAALLRPKLQLDQITTGSIMPPTKSTRSRITAISPQPLPDETDVQRETVQFISATKSRALAVVDGKLTIYMPGDRLPDGRLIYGFEQVGGQIRPLAEDVNTSPEGPRSMSR